MTPGRLQLVRPRRVGRGVAEVVVAAPLGPVLVDAGRLTPGNFHPYHPLRIMPNNELPPDRSDVVPTGVLVLYGAPPTMKLASSTGKSLDKVFELTGANRVSFEVALRRALSAFLGEHVSVAAATMIYIRDVAEFADALRKASGRTSHLLWARYRRQQGSVAVPWEVDCALPHRQCSESVARSRF